MGEEVRQQQEGFVKHKSQVEGNNNLFEQYRERALNVLERENFLRRDEEGNIICNLDRFRDTIDFNYFRDSVGPLAIDKKYGGGRFIPTLFHTFHDLVVYSEEDYKKLRSGQAIEPKPLLYIPKNKETALSIEDVRQAQFYLGLWEVGRMPRLPKEYPTQEDGFQSGVSSAEVALACVIYHPQYRDGERRDDGRLYIRFNPNVFDPDYKDTYLQGDPNEKRPISGTFIESWRLSFRNNDKASPADRPAELDVWNQARQNTQYLREMGVFAKAFFQARDLRVKLR